MSTACAACGCACAQGCCPDCGRAYCDAKCQREDYFSVGHTSVCVAARVAHVEQRLAHVNLASGHGTKRKAEGDAGDEKEEEEKEKEEEKEEDAMDLEEDKVVGVSAGKVDADGILVTLRKPPAEEQAMAATLNQSMQKANGSVKDQDKRPEIWMTGWALGDVLVGRLGTNAGVLIRLSLSADATDEERARIDPRLFRPAWGTHYKLFLSPILQQAFRRIERFATMTTRQMMDYVRARELPPSKKAPSQWIEDVAPAGLQIEFLSGGNADSFFFECFGPEDQDRLMSGPIAFSEFLDMVPDGYTNALWLKLPFWSLDDGLYEVQGTDNVPAGAKVVAVRAGIADTDARFRRIRTVPLDFAAAGADAGVHDFIWIKYAAADERPVMPLQRKDIDYLFRQLWPHGEESGETLAALQVARALDAKSLKSLMQKIVRFRPLHVLVPAHGMPFADNVPVPGRPVASALLLMACLAGILAKPGYFIPELRAQVTGVQSVAKRLLVIAGEDTYATPQTMAELAAASLLAQDDTNWFPSPRLLAHWGAIARALYEERRHFAYDKTARWTSFVATGEDAALLASSPLSRAAFVAGLDLTQSEHQLAFAAAALAMVGSFDGDKLLFDIIATDAKVRAEAAVARADAPWTQPMPLWHYLDQHVTGDFLYFAALPWWEKHTTALRSKPSKEAIKILFDTVFQITGLNPRKHAEPTSTTPEGAAKVALLNEVRRMQELAFHRLFQLHPDSDAAAAQLTHLRREERVFRTTLSDMWLAAMVGDRTVLKSRFIACLDVNNIYAPVVATMKPPRDKKDVVMPDEGDLLRAAAEFEALLCDGFPIPASAAVPHESFRNQCVRLVIDEATGARQYAIYPPGNKQAGRPWGEAAVVESRVPTFGEPHTLPLPPFLERAAAGRMPQESVAAVVPNADDVFQQQVLQKATHKQMARLAQWLAVATPEEFRVPHFTRMQSASGEHASLRPAYGDLEVFQTLVWSIVDLYPAALRLKQGSLYQFSIPDALAFQHVRDLVIARLRVTVAMNGAREQEALLAEARAYVLPATALVDAYPRELLQRLETFVPGANAWNAKALRFGEDANRRDLAFQHRAVFRLVQRFLRQGMLRDILWMEPGAGKTSIVARFLGVLARLGCLPDYVIYLLPKSAMETVEAELRKFGFRVNKFGGSVAALKKKGRLDRYEISLIEHDWLKETHPVVLKAVEEVIADSFCVVDEMHKATTATTQRTANILSAISRCRGFLGMTGTPFLNRRPDQLVGWLSLILPFAVQRRNVWTGMGVIVAEPVPADKDVRVDEHDLGTLMGADAHYLGMLRALRSPMGLKGGFLALFTYMCDHFVYPAYVALARTALATPSGAPNLRPRGQSIALVVYNHGDVDKVAQMLVEAGVATAEDIFCMGQPAGGASGGGKGRGAAKKARVTSFGRSPDGTINFTDEAVRTGACPDYRIVVVPSRMNAGYSLSRCERMITFPYPSNEADRTQMRMRINRVDQAADRVAYTYVVGDLLTNMYHRMRDAKSLVDCMRILLAAD